MSKGEEVVALIRSKAGQWYYTNDYRRLDPDTYGATDCSGTLRWALAKFGKDIGYWTGDQSHSGREIARGHYPSEIPWDILKPGDRILMTAKYWNNYDFDEYLCHTECYCGGGTMIGFPGGWGPTEKWAQSWMEAYGCITWKVMRDFEEDDMEAIDILGYSGPKDHDMYLRKNKDDDGTKIDAFQMWWNASEQLTRTDNAGWKTPEKHDIFGRVNHIEEMCMELSEKLDNLSVGNVNVNIDYDKIATMVADKFAARMKE